MYSELGRDSGAEILLLPKSIPLIADEPELPCGVAIQNFHGPPIYSSSALHAHGGRCCQRRACPPSAIMTTSTSFFHAGEIECACLRYF